MASDVKSLGLRPWRHIVNQEKQEWLSKTNILTRAKQLCKFLFRDFQQANNALLANFPSKCTHQSLWNWPSESPPAPKHQGLCRSLSHKARGEECCVCHLFRAVWRHYGNDSSVALLALQKDLWNAAPANEVLRPFCFPDMKLQCEFSGTESKSSLASNTCMKNTADYADDKWVQPIW